MTLSLDIERNLTAPATARRAVDGLSAVVAEDVLRDVRLLVSELVTNSVKYGGEGALHLQIDADGPRKLRAEVIDQGVGFVPVARDRPATGPRPRSAAGAFTSCRRSPTAGASTRARRTSGSRSIADARRARQMTGPPGHSTSLVEACLPVLPRSRTLN